MRLRYVWWILTDASVWAAQYIHSQLPAAAAASGWRWSRGLVGALNGPAGCTCTQLA